jgi:hypothetical protein
MDYSVNNDNRPGINIVMAEIMMSKPIIIYSPSIPLNPFLARASLLARLSLLIPVESGLSLWPKLARANISSIS